MFYVYKVHAFMNTFMLQEFLTIITQLISELWFLPFVGVISGLAAGVFGIGGGGLLVPILVAVFAVLGIDENLRIHMAIATSLAIIIFNSMSAIHTHQKMNAIRWDIMLWLFPALFIGAYAGAYLAALLDGEVLVKVFGIAMVLIGFRMYFGGQPKPTLTLSQSSENLLHMISGLVFGKLSALIGIGGGTFAVPYLVWRGLDMRKAVAGGAAGGLAIALAASFFNLNQPIENPPEYSIGFIYIPAVIGIGIVSVFFARIGANLAHNLDGAKLKRYFAIFLFVVGVKFLL